MQHLAVEVAQIDRVPVAQPQPADPGRCQVEGRGAAETAQADDERRGGGEAGLGWRGEGGEEEEGKKEVDVVEVEKREEKANERRKREEGRENKSNHKIPYLQAQTREAASACSSARPVAFSEGGLLPRRQSPWHVVAEGKLTVLICRRWRRHS